MIASTTLGIIISKTFWKSMPDTWEEWTPIIVAIVTAIILKNIVQYLFRRSERQQNLRGRGYSLIKHSLYALIYLSAFIVVVYNIPPFRQIALSLLASAGIMAVVLGFAAQHAFANIVSGVFIIMFKPFKVGDIIEISDHLVGVVEDITLRHTVIRNFEHRRIVVPNAEMSREIIVNSDIRDARIRKHYNVNIAFHSDVEKAMQIVQQTATEHPLCLDNRTEEEIKKNEPIVEVKLIGFNNYALNIKAWVWAVDAEAAFELACSLNVMIKKRFDEAGIQLALPHHFITQTPNNSQPDVTQQQ